MVREVLKKITWLGHDGFAIHAGNTNIVIDPFQIGERDRADIILVTHSHPDHCSTSNRYYYRSRIGKEPSRRCPDCQSRR